MLRTLPLYEGGFGALVNITGGNIDTLYKKILVGVITPTELTLGFVLMQQIPKGGQMMC